MLLSKQARLLMSRLVSRQRMSTSAPKRGGGGGGHHGEANNKDNLFMKIFADPPHPREHQGYFYRELGNVQGRSNAAIAKVGITVAWWWVFYHLLTDFHGLVFGHHEYPDTAKWTDAELGIPADHDD